MHRETLSRSLLYSHNLIGKPIATLVCRNISLHGGHSRTQNGKAIETSPVVRRYHRSWEKRTQSITKSVIAEASDKNLVEPPPEISSGSFVAQPAKLFNIRARDILNVPDEPVQVKGSSFIAEPENSSVTNRSLLETKIFDARSVEELLKLSSEQDLTLKHACLVISRLGNFSQLKNDARLTLKIQNDKRFTRIFNLIQRGNHSQFPHTLLQALNGLQKLGMESSLEVSTLLERELSWSMRRCPLRFLAKSVRILHDSIRSTSAVASGPSSDSNGNNAKQQDVLDAAIKVLHRRWIEAINGSDFISLFQVIDLFDDERKLKIEERAADIAHQFTPPEMLKMFVVLGTKKRRPTPLLRALAFHLCKSEHKYNGKEAIELIYALNELTFADPIFMNKLCTDLAEEIPHLNNSALISALMTSLGQMRYKNKDVLFAVDEWISKNLENLRVFDFAAWLQASATLGYHSENMIPFCRKAREVLTQSASSCPMEWVNIVHSFTLLNEYDCEILSSVLNPAFVESIDKEGAKSGKQKLKLLNLNYIASHWKGKEYKGEFIDDAKVKEWTMTLVSSTDEKLSKLLIDSLATFLPPEKYLIMNSQKESGVFVDAKCFFDRKMNPMTLEAAKSKPSSEVTQVAFVVEGYPVMCLGLKHPTGNSALNKKILESQNLIVVTIPYTEFRNSEKLVKRVQYLEQKIKALKNASESSN